MKATITTVLDPILGEMDTFVKLGKSSQGEGEGSVKFIVETQEVFTLTEYFTWKVISLKCVFRPKRKAQKPRNNLRIINSIKEIC